MNRFHRAATPLILVSMLILGSTLSLAQSSTGTIQGSVADSQGAVIPNASVTITSQGTGRSVAVSTSGDGLFSVPTLEPGPYKVELRRPISKAPRSRSHCRRLKC